MRHKYNTRGIILFRKLTGEANEFVTLLSPELGLLRARAQGVRQSGAKLSSALVTFAESDFILVRGKEGWRVTGAILVNNWFTCLSLPASRMCAARISGLLLRLVVGETLDKDLYPTFLEFLSALHTFPEEMHDAIEILAALQILSALGLAEGMLSTERILFSKETLLLLSKNRARYIARINKGIVASGL